MGIEERLGWSVEVVKHPPKPRGEWRPIGDLNDLSIASISSGFDSHLNRRDSAARYREALGGGTDHWLALSEQADEQRLRAIVRDEPGHDPCGDEPSDAEEARPCLTLLAQLLVLRQASMDG